MPKPLITKEMEHQALLKSARLVHRRWEMTRCSMAILISFIVQRPIKEVLSLKWAEIDSKAGLIKRLGIVSQNAFALILGASSWKIEGSEYVFPDRWERKLSMERFEEIREAIDDENGMENFFKPECDRFQ